jgi:hypothetical protein
MMFKKQPNSFLGLKKCWVVLWFYYNCCLQVLSLEEHLQNEEIWDMGLGENSKPAI